MSAVPCGPGIDIWRSCRFIGALMRSLCSLPGGMGSFIPCRIGTNHCRLRHIGWEKSGHGLTSRPRETSSVAFLNDLVVQILISSLTLLLRCWSMSFPLRHCAARFASNVTTWRLPARGSIADLLAEGGVEVGIVQVAPFIGAGVGCLCWCLSFARWFWS